MTKSDEMATPTGLHKPPRSRFWWQRVIIPLDVRPAYGTKTKIIKSLRTEDKAEARRLGALFVAQCEHEFADKRRALNPQRLDAITPELAQTIAARIRSAVLQGDDSLRSGAAGGLLQELTKRHPLNALRINQEPATADALAGLDPLEVRTLAELNASVDGEAATNLAARNLRSILPMVTREFRALGFNFDVAAPGARDALEAALKAHRLARAEVVARDEGAVIDTPSMPFIQAAQPIKAKTLRDVFERWEVSGEKPRSTDSINAMNRALRQFEGQHPALPLPDITRELGDGYRAWLIGQPGTRKTARDKFTALKTLLKYACRELEWTARHTWEGLDIKAKTTNKRRPYTPDELSRLFGTALHSAYALPDVATGGRTAVNGGRDAAYWIPLLGAYTGARLGELCQLRTCDVRYVDGLPVIDITDDGEDQKVKNEAGVRTVPVHSALQRLGFMEYAKAMQAAGSDSLWPHLPLRKDKPSDYFGRWFRVLRLAVGLGESRQTTFHYFRHTVRPLMRRAGYNDATMDKVTGHETGGSVGTVVYDHWELKELQPAVEAIRHDGLELPQVSPYGFPAKKQMP